MASRSRRGAARCVGIAAGTGGLPVTALTWLCRSRMSHSAGIRPGDRPARAVPSARPPRGPAARLRAPPELLPPAHGLSSHACRPPLPSPGKCIPMQQDLSGAVTPRRRFTPLKPRTFGCTKLCKHFSDDVVPRSCSPLWEEPMFNRRFPESCSGTGPPASVGAGGRGHARIGLEMRGGCHKKRQR